MSSTVSLWPHQERAIKFGANRYAVGLSMPMGTGKTLTYVALLNVWKPRTVLVVSSAKITTDPLIWPRHLNEFSEKPVVVSVLTGRTPTMRDAMYDPSPDTPTVYLINFESVWREPLATTLLKYPPDVLVVDESHRAKSPSGVLSRFLARLGKRCKRRVAGTGTMLAHSPLDAWAQSRFLDDTVLGGSYYKFRDRYARMGGYMGKEILSGKNGVPWLNQEELSQRLSRLWFTCEHPTLPFPVQRVTSNFELPDKTKNVCSKMEQDFALSVEEMVVSAPLAITRLVRILQICSGFVKTDDSAEGELGKIVELDESRMEALIEILEDIDIDEKIVVFVGKFNHDLLKVWEAARRSGRQYFEVSGRHSQVEQWRDAPPGAVLGVNPASGAEGLDFTHSRYCIFYSHQHSLYLREQAISRVLRPPGAGAPPGTRIIIDLCSTQNSEQAVLDGLQHKKDVVQAVYERIKGYFRWQP